VTGPSPIEAALRRHRLAEVARRTGITLPTDTGSVTVRCPLPSHRHPDRTPSLRLYLDDDRYYCFGCAAKGDVIQWARDTEGIGVAAAIQALDSGRSLTNAWAAMTSTATSISRPRPPVGGASRSLEPGQVETPDLGRTPPGCALAALAAAWAYYTCPPLHARASAYLSGRSIDVGILEAHTGRPETGHTPARADGLVNALRARGFSDHELVDAGLAHRQPGEGPVSDFYRQRVLIPVRDEHQRVVGLIGRNVGDQQRWAKYKNPPRTAVYDKSINLYQPLPPPADTDGHVIVVEGTLDAMAIAVAAIRSCCAERFCPVTQSGRQLSAHQIRYVRHLDPHPILAFDADDAGDQSTSRVGALFALAGADPGVVHLPPGEDPASWLAHDGIHRLAGLAPGANPDRNPARRPAAHRPSAHTLASPAAAQIGL
jgi:DNA primase